MRITPLLALSRLGRRLLGRNRATPDEIEQEIEFHLQCEADRLIEQGVRPDEAWRRARVRFGTPSTWRDEMREIHGIGPFERLTADLRFGLRVLRRSPSFTIVATLTLALGIGASTAIFSVVDGILLRSLPYDQPEQLVTVWSDYTRRDGPQREWWSFPNYFDFRNAAAATTATDSADEGSAAPPASAQDKVFQGLGLWSGWNPTLSDPQRGSAEQLSGAMVSHDMLSEVLRARVLAGRSFAASDGEPGAELTAMVSERLWRDRFGSDPDLLGKQLQLNGESWTVIGVLPADFRQPLVSQADLWGVFRVSETDPPGGRASARVRALGRLADGVTLESAREHSRSVAAALEQEYPQANTGVGVALFPLEEDIVGGVRNGLLLLLAGVVATLLIVCVNLANLLLARGSARRREFTMRSALGASRGRLIRQLLTESLLLALLGGLGGVAVAWMGTRLLVSLAPSSTPRLDEVAVDLRTLAFTFFASLICGLLFGLLPALAANRRQLTKDLGRQVAGRSPEGLVVVQIAGALTLLICAGLLVQSFRQLAGSGLGFRPEGAVSVQVFASRSQYPEIVDATNLFDRVGDELESLPGVVRVGRVDTLPLAGFNGDVDFLIEGREIPSAGEANITWFRRAAPEYFSTLGIRLVGGRDFSPSDDAQAQLVVAVNETLARRHFGDESPLGQRININSPDEPKWREIVAVVSDVKNFDLREAARPAMYAPYLQVPGRNTFFVLRTDQSGSEAVDGLIAAARERVAAVDSELAPVIRPLESYVDSARSQERFVTWLFGLFAILALLLAVVGVYGVVSYRIAQRRREFGLRLALGASATEVAAAVVRRNCQVAAVGVGLGLATALFAGRGLDSLIYGVSRTDPATFVGLASALIVAATLASLIPAARASRTNPVEVLREE